MIQLTSYEISTQGTVDLFKIFFQYRGVEPARIRISVWDRVLNPGDHHILDSEPFFKSLTEKIKEYEAYLG